MTAGTFTDVASMFNVGFEIEAGFNANTGAQLWMTNRTLDPFARDQITTAGYGVYIEIDADKGKWSVTV
jgi:hypothetical protein